MKEGNKTMSAQSLIVVNNLKQYFKINEHLTIKAVDGISFDIKEGEILGLVGETGCGKSTVAKAISGIYIPTDGEILFSGKSLEKEKKRSVSDIQLIFQDSGSALNPRMTVEKIILEPLKIAGFPGGKDIAVNRMKELLYQVGLDEIHLSKYPTELSGGQRQRVAIARSLLTSPKLIIADEPIASLDISIQSQIINLFKDIQREYNFSFLFIAHDLCVVRYLCDRVGVMLKGKLVEVAQCDELFSNPVHPYTKSLLSAIHMPDPDYEKTNKMIDYNTELPLDGKLVDIGNNHLVLQ